MTIANFKKMTIFGLNPEQANFLTQLQKMGCLHLISINPKKITTLTTSSVTLADEIKKALSYLKDTPEKAKAKKTQEQFNADETVALILENQKQLREAIDRHDFLIGRIKDLSVWGNFRLPKDGEIGNLRLWFYKIRRKDINLIPNNYIVQELHHDESFIYIVVLSGDEPSVEEFTLPRTHTGSISLETLRAELQDTLEKIDDLNEERRRLTRYRFLLSREFDNFTDRTALQEAGQKIYDHNDFFLMQGWIPQENIESIKEFCEKHKLGFSIETPTHKEKPPTLLQTYPWASAGTELVNFYQTPGYHALDPSLMLFFSFSIFFGIILADAGYGLVIAVFTLLFWKWMGKFNASVWLRPLLVAISIFSIIYGAMLGSYFGIELSSKSFLGHLKILDINNFKMMMRLVIVIGCLHIIAANAMRAWFATNIYLRMLSLGYIFLIIGFMILGFGFINHSNNMIKLACIIIGASVLTLVIFAGNEPVTNFKSFLSRLAEGLKAVAEISSLFGDILSYLRLFALGLAGASLAVTFNHIATHIAHTTSQSYGWILAFLILLAGQTLNLLLCIMSGVIHGLRLNYIEFLKWSVTEDGYAYKPFKKAEVSHE